jgi:MoaA/NifB/PqqE/SkfB family radical SAM enzyme
LRSFTRPTGMLQDDLFKKTIDELHQKLLYLIFYFQGEPYLHPRFLELAQYASSKGIYTATSTNAHYLNDENARKTVESGLDQHHYFHRRHYAGRLPELPRRRQAG